MVGHTFNPSPWEAEAGGSLRVRAQPGLQSEFQASLDYIVKPCLNITSNILCLKKMHQTITIKKPLCPPFYKVRKTEEILKSSSSTF